MNYDECGEKLSSYIAWQTEEEHCKILRAVTIRIEHPSNMSVALTLELTPHSSYCLLCVHNLSKLKSFLES